MPIFVLDLLAEKVGERAGAGKLHVAVRILLRVPHKLGDDRLALLVVNAFGDGDDATAVPLERLFTSVRNLSITKARSGR